MGFIAHGKLRKINIFGGPPQTLCDAEGDRGGTWNEDGVILFAPDAGGPLYRVSDTGGTASPVTTLDSSRKENGHRWPKFLPDGKRFVYVARSANPELTSIFVRSLDLDDSEPLVGAYSSVDLLPPLLLYVRGETLMAQRFDDSRAALLEDPFPVIEHVGSFVAIGKANFSSSANGTLAYHPHVSDYELPAWVDRQGRPLGDSGSPADYSQLTLSPDARRLAIERVDPKTGTPDIWLVDLSQGTTSRFTSHPAGDYCPVWSPDGSRIVFASNRLGGEGTDLFSRTSSGAGEEDLLFQSDAIVFANDWSSDGRFIIYQALDSTTKNDLWALPLEGERKPIPLLQTSYSETSGTLSPDGRWLAYTSDESGRLEVYVRPFLRLGGSRLISTNGGVQPRWRGDGKELFYLSPERRVMSVAVESDESGFQGGVPRVLFEAPIISIEPETRSYSVSRDGQRFLINTVLPEASAPIQIVVNWTPEPK